MEFFQTAEGIPFRLGILPGTFNPVTIAHLALAQAALAIVDEVVFVLPRAFPHKPYTGATLPQRVQMLQDALRSNASLSIAASDSGLFVEIAAECRAAYLRTTRFTFLCGRDAAERIAHWDYGEPEAFDAMLRQFDLLVAARAGDYEVPAKWSGAIERLELPGLFDHVSSTEVRERIALGEPWEHLVPAEVREQVRGIYR
ncbi:MAG: adenylyltransferase/cytidyltransferase family protein [Candidatus Sulfopaludibacter sp.]|nr:adenylyltransferase/cytidyltransferase family protein [Candidatus Sulfopaludibacter sp.]